MVGIITDPFPTGDQAYGPGLGAYKSGSWEAMNWFGQATGLDRLAGEADQTARMEGSPFIAELGGATPPPASAVLDPQEANEKFGIPGQLKFDGAVPESVAQSQHDAKLEEMIRADADVRSPAGFWGQAGRQGAKFVSDALDPLNVAASFIPVVGEARYAAWLARAGGPMARTLVRAGVGAAQGAVGQAALEPLNYGIARSLQDDYGASDALLDLAFGALLGGGLHAGVGAVLPYHPELKPDAIDEGFRSSAAAAIADQDPEAREAALRTAIAQMAQGSPVEVDPVFRAASLRQDLMSSTALGRSVPLPDEAAGDGGSLSAARTPRDPGGTADPALAAARRNASGQPLPEDLAAKRSADTAMTQPPAPATIAASDPVKARAQLEAKNAELEAQVARSAVNTPRVPVTEASGDLAGDVARLVEAAKAPGNKQSALRFGKLGEGAVAKVKAAGLDLGGFDHVMQTSDVRHALREHGPGAKLQPGEIPLKPEDLARVPEIVETADRVDRGESKSGQGAVRFIKREADGTSFVVEEVHRGRNRLAFKTMYRMEEGGPGATDGGTPEGGPGPVIRPEDARRPSPTSGTEEDIGASGGGGNGLPPELAADPEIKAAAEQAQQAETLSKAWEQAAACMTGRP